MLLTVFGRTRNRLAPVLLWRLRAPCPTAKEEEGRQESENTLAKSHAILLRWFEARAPSRDSRSLTAFGQCFATILNFQTAFQRKGDGPLDYSNAFSKSPKQER